MDDIIKVCPECGKVLKGVNIVAHSLTHFPEYLDPAKSSKLARERQKRLLAGGITLAEYKKSQEVE